MGAKKKIRYATIAASVAMAGVMASGCGTSGALKNGDQSAQQESASTHQPVTITVASWNDAADSLRAEIPGFEKKYPWIKVNVEYVDTAYQKVIPELVAGDAPDIIQVQQRDFQTFLHKFPGDFVDLTPYMSSIKNHIAPVALDVTMQNGHIYAAPWDLGPAAMYYRKDLFREAGINPNTIKTWADYLAAGKKLVAHFHGKVKMLAENTSEPSQGIQTTLMILVNELGGSYVSRNGNIDFLNPQIEKAMSVIQQWGKAGIVADAPTWNDGIAAFANGQVATILSAVWYAGTMMNSAPKQSGLWGIAPLPAFTPGGNNEADTGGSVLAITKDSKNAQAAWDFINYCLYTVPGENVQLKYGLFPSWESYYTAKGTDFDQNFPYFGMPIYKFFASVSKHIPTTNYGGYFEDYSQPLSQAYISVFKGANIEQALQTAETNAARISGQPISNG